MFLCGDYMKKVFAYFVDRPGRALFISEMFKNEITQSQFILDVGCDINTLKKLVGSKVIGVDLYGNPDYQINFETEGLARFSQNQFDLVVCTEVLEHLENFHEMLGELIRVSSRYILISLPNCMDFFTRINILFRGQAGKFYGLPSSKPSDRHRWFFSHSDAEKLFLDLGEDGSISINESFVLCNYGFSWRGRLVRAFIALFKMDCVGQSCWFLLEKK